MVIEDLPDVPPAALLLYTEVYAKAPSWDDARKLLKALLPELKRQSRSYDTERFDKKSVAPAVSSFDIHLDGALNPFDHGGAACSDLRCRVAAAERIARSMGLMADRIWITDYLTETFCDFGRATGAKLDKVVADTLILGKLMPLVAAGVLRFKSPWIPSCRNCLETFEQEVTRTSDHLVAAFKQEFELEDMGGSRYAIHTGSLFDPPLVLRIHPGRGQSRQPPDMNNCMHRIVHRAVRSTMWIGREAAAGRGSVFSNSRAGLAGMVYQEGRFRDARDLRLLDESRNVDLPWVGQLAPAQVMQLREEASRALPQFRELLASHLVYRPEQQGSADADASGLIGALRQQAAEVRDELQIVNKHAKRFWRQPFTILSLGAAALGVATDQTLSAAGGLLALWQFLGTHDPGNEKDTEKLQCRPGYVLVKAQDLLAHAA